MSFIRPTVVTAALCALAAIPALAGAQDGSDCDPAYGCDREAPVVKLKLTGAKLKTLAKTGKLKVSVSSNEGGSVRLSGKGKAGSRSLSFGSAKVNFSDQGSRTATLTLTSTSRAALRKYARSSSASRGVRVTITGSAEDELRNKRKLSLTKTIK